MKINRISIHEKYLADKIMNQGFDIRREDKYQHVNVDALVNPSNFMDTEYRCECGAFIGSDIIGQKCPRCNTEISLHALNFRYSGYIDLGEHYVITYTYYVLLKRILGINLLNFILGNFKEEKVIEYTNDDPEFYETKRNKRKGRMSEKDIEFIIKKIPKSKQIYKGLGHDQFRERFDEIISTLVPADHPDLYLLKEPNIVDKVFTNKIVLYSTAFRPVSKTSETMFYPKINKSFSSIVSISTRLEDMILPEEKIEALNAIQNYYNEAIDHILKEDLSKKTGFVRKEIVGGTFNFSGRGVITFDNSLNADEVDLPYSMVITAYQYKVAHIISVRNNTSLEQALLYINTYDRSPMVLSIIDEIISQNQWIFLIREPANNLASIELCKIRKYKIDDDTISLPPEPLAGFNADFDGDALDCGFLPKELVEDFESFHYSCMANFIDDKITIDLKEWNAICLGRMSR